MTDLYNYVNPKNGKHSPLISKETYDIIMANADVSGKKTVISRLCSHCAGQKSLGYYCLIHIFSIISRFPLGTVHPFQNFLAVLTPPTLYKVETGKKFWIHASNIVCGVRGGVGPVWIGKRPRNSKVSQDLCPWLWVASCHGMKTVLDATSVYTFKQWFNKHDFCSGPKLHHTDLKGGATRIR